jgi:hypothetical protein
MVSEQDREKGGDVGDETSGPPTVPMPAPVEQRPRRALPTGFATLRDLLLFLIGLVIIANEVFFQPNVEPASMAVGLAMTGLPLVFSADERRKG